MDIGEWLGNLGLQRYNAAFRENAIDTDVLRDLTDQDLEKLGVLLGDRRRLLRAIAALDDGSAAASSPAPVKSPVTMPLISAAAASPTSSTVEVSGELIDTAGASFGELPQFAEQQVSAPTTEMVATQQRQSTVLLSPKALVLSSKTCRVRRAGTGSFPREVTDIR